MTTLNKILSAADRTKFATDTGAKMHAILQHITISDHTNNDDAEIISRIKANPDILRFFSTNSRTEAPIAGTINGRFISRRLDRLVIDPAAQTIAVLDYKTDTDRTILHNQYVAQIREYVALLRTIYPTYKITGHILWTHDFSLENIPLK
ncbi:MAG: hypothetical protein IJX89_00320 [Alphaproteobacteria bacterium]|nr:hypothetical protein [Alphaproteobacteria bacterium]